MVQAACELVCTGAEKSVGFALRVLESLCCLKVHSSAFPAPLFWVCSPGCMPESLPTLTPAALEELLMKVDEVCAQAKALRAEIMKTMQRHRADDRPSKPAVIPKPRRAAKRR